MSVRTARIRPRCFFESATRDSKVREVPRQRATYVAKSERLPRSKVEPDVPASLFEKRRHVSATKRKTL